VVLALACGVQDDLPRPDPSASLHCGRELGCEGDEPYVVEHGWPELEHDFVLGQVSGVDVDSHGHVFVFHRADRPWLDAPNTGFIAAPTILRLDGVTGRIEAELGRNTFVVPHGLRVDHRDHLWVTDVGTHMVHELDHEGRILRSWGTPSVPGADSRHFNQPTDVAVASDGSFYVADGYGNSRVVSFTADGRFLREFGRFGSAPGELDTPHSIALDAQGRLLVADRGNGRIQRFAQTGALIDEWQSMELGRPWAIDVDAVGRVWSVDGGDQNLLPPDRGRILRLRDDGSVDAAFGSFGNQDGQIYWGHAIAVMDDGAVLVGDVRYGMRVQKWHPRESDGR
jgi:sugar lactone lactonase YvrE